MVTGVVDNAELARGNTMDGRLGMDCIATVAEGLETGGKVLGGVAYLQRDVLGRQHAVDAVEVMDGEVLLVGGSGVVAVTDVEDILRYVLLDDEPRTATEPHALALADGVEP